MNLITEIEELHYKADLPEISSGDSVKVDVRVTEGSRERIQSFEGTVIAFNGKGINKSITVRKVSFGVGVERIFPIHAPIISEISILKKGKVRRSKLYYLRTRIGKSAKVKEDR
jgi:large subunit ribosomal protein L19|tara:strand:+ start:1795 stop:2136 length:342 start_codon:yes stop_codon:yes gene_type:complete